MGAGSYACRSGVQPSTPYLLTAGQEDWAEGLGYRELPNLRGIPMFKDPFSVRALPGASLPLPPLPFSLPLVTSPLGMSKCKMQKPGPTTQPKDQLWLVAQAVLPPRSTPGS